MYNVLAEDGLENASVGAIKKKKMKNNFDFIVTLFFEVSLNAKYRVIHSLS